MEGGGGSIGTRGDRGRWGGWCVESLDVRRVEETEPLGWGGVKRGGGGGGVRESGGGEDH